MLKLLPDWLPTAGIALIALSLGVFLGSAVGIMNGRALGKAEAKAEAAAEAIKRVTDMEKNNATFRNLPARERCRVFMRDSGLPADNCDQR
jgi:hypothetical protein